ncbi:UNVERIFIED_ORG: hypothetical protein QE434_000037 [Rhizobium sp. SORGH_AS 755]|jgi:hypothetical protein|nr:hypothetical protein [Rhizobium sp. SORGH_AS_0755]
MISILKSSAQFLRRRDWLDAFQLKETSTFKQQEAKASIATVVPRQDQS